MHKIMRNLSQIVLAEISSMCWSILVILKLHEKRTAFYAILLLATLLTVGTIYITKKFSNAQSKKNFRNMLILNILLFIATIILDFIGILNPSSNIEMFLMCGCYFGCLFATMFA